MIGIGLIVGALASTFMAPYILGAIGFTAAGIAAGSAAAVWQASIGNVVGGSLFALLQSIGAAGLGMLGMTLTALTGGIAAGGIAIIAVLFL